MKMKRVILDTNISGGKPNEFLKGLNIIRIHHMPFNLLADINFFGFFGFHKSYLAMRIYKSFGTE